MGAIYHAGSKYGGIGFDSFASIDEGSLLHTFSDGTSGRVTEVWQATDDCFITGLLVYSRAVQGNSTSYVYISSTYSTVADIQNYGVRVAYAYVDAKYSNDSGLGSLSNVAYTAVCVPVKKGQYVLIAGHYAYMSFIKAYKAKKSSPQATAIDEENILRYPNYSDVIKSGAENNSQYTMPRNGWITGFFRYDQSLNGGNIAAIRVDDSYVACAWVGVSGVSGDKNNLEAVLIPVKAGSIIKFVNGTFTNIKIVGTL